MNDISDATSALAALVSLAGSGWWAIRRALAALARRRAPRPSQLDPNGEDADWSL